MSGVDWHLSAITIGINWSGTEVDNYSKPIQLWKLPFGYHNLPSNMFVCQKYKLFRISEVNVSDITLQISFRIFEMLFGYVMTLHLRLCIGHSVIICKQINEIQSLHIKWKRSANIFGATDSARRPFLQQNTCFITHLCQNQPQNTHRTIKGNSLTTWAWPHDIKSIFIQCLSQA